MLMQPKCSCDISLGTLKSLVFVSARFAGQCTRLREAAPEQRAAVMRKLNEGGT